MEKVSLWLVSVTVCVSLISLGMAEDEVNRSLQGQYGLNGSLSCVQAKADENGMYPPLPHFDPDTHELLVAAESATHTSVGVAQLSGDGSWIDKSRTLGLSHTLISVGDVPVPPQPEIDCEGTYTLDSDGLLELEQTCTQTIPGDVPLTATIGPLFYRGYVGADPRMIVLASVSDNIASMQLALPDGTVVGAVEGMCTGVQTLVRIDSDPLYFAQFGNGVGGFTSDVVLANPSQTAAVSGTVDFTDDSGAPLEVGMATGGDPVSSVNFSVEPLGAVTISTDGEGDLLVGSAQVNGDGDLGGVIRFNFPGVGSAGFGSSEALTGFISPVQRQAGGLSTGLALHNPGQDAVTLHLTLRDESGVPVTGGTETIEDFPSLGHLAKFIEELFGEADTNDFRGSLVVEVTGGRVAASIMEFDSATAKFTTLPVTPLN